MARLKRKTYFVDEEAVRHARRSLGVSTDAEAVRIAIERVSEMEKYWKFMDRSRNTLKKGSIPLILDSISPKLVIDRPVVLLTIFPYARGRCINGLRKRKR